MWKLKRMTTRNCRPGKCHAINASSRVEDQKEKESRQNRSCIERRGKEGKNTAVGRGGKGGKRGEKKDSGQRGI